MYGILLILHNITRWLVLVAAVYALYTAYSGWFGAKVYSTVGRQAGTIFGNVTGIQFILGLLLYFWPTGFVIGRLTNGGIGAAMRDSEARFFVVEHITLMVLAIALVHIGGGVARRAPSDAAKFRRAAIFYTISTILILIAIPWWRPLFH